MHIIPNKVYTGFRQKSHSPNELKATFKWNKTHFDQRYTKTKMNLRLYLLLTKLVAFSEQTQLYVGNIFPQLRNHDRVWLSLLFATKFITV